MTSAGATIDFKNVRKTYGKFVALEDFSMRVEGGEFMTLLGASGSGKTTALNSLAGFVDIDGGEILIDGVPITKLPTEKRDIGMVFQNYSLFPHRSVIRNISFPLEMRGVARDEARRRSFKALEMVRLDSLANRMPHELSGGQKQRVAFARAVVFEPRVLLMDEPLGALDLKLRETLQLEIKEYQRQIGCTVIYVTHDQSEALTLSDRMAVMDKGRVLQIGTPEQLYDRPQSRFVAGFVGSNNILKVQSVEEGFMTLEGLGRFKGDGRHLIPGGFVSIRPELITIRHGGSGAHMAHLSEAVFFGNSVRYILRAADSKEISAIEHRRPGQDVLPLGTAVAFDLDTSDLVPLLD
ncbi:ABC transporter ATP-binding protein [Microvirga pudoricolor]|uniref:ABC transporter ATP-binding protein n=1 Tax=Microvirga pudoricolor TaxID=2778729 RepID=UPI001950EE5F|nr:ABC transporter ATP-binding protein [Microvirga pudoricolor]MBM6595111.1 ABC transporter ATP-binding protein [Microvirga pudoricolor]